MTVDDLIAVLTELSEKGHGDKPCHHEDYAGANDWEVAEATFDAHKVLLR